MTDLIGKICLVLVTIGLLSTGITRCSIDLENGAKFMRGVGGSMLGTSNPEIGGNCEDGVCVESGRPTQSFDRPRQPTQFNQPSR